MRNVIFGIKKSTLGEWNRGHCGSNNNCRYKGITTCWVVFEEELKTGEKTDHIALSRKCDAEKMADYLTSIQYDGIGCPLMIFKSALRTAEDWDTLDKIKEV